MKLGVQIGLIASRLHPWPHYVRWGPSSPPPKGTVPQFSAHICCGQMAGCIKMPFGREVGLGPREIVLNGDPASLLKRTAEPAPNFQPIFSVAKRLDVSRCHLV